MDNTVIFKSSVFTHTELKVLLGGMGVKNFMGLKIDDTPVDSTAALNAINGLVLRGVLESSGEAFTLRPGYKQLFEMIGKQERVIFIDRSSLTGREAIAVYAKGAVRGRFAVLRASGMTKLSLSLCTVSELVRLLTDECWLPSQDEPPEFEDEIRRFTAGELCKTPETLCSITEGDVQVLSVVMIGLCRAFCEEDLSGKRYAAYSVKGLKDRLSAIIFEENFNDNN